MQNNLQKIECENHLQKWKYLQTQKLSKKLYSTKPLTWYFQITLGWGPDNNLTDLGKGGPPYPGKNPA